MRFYFGETKAIFYFYTHQSEFGPQRSGIQNGSLSSECMREVNPSHTTMYK